jgi:hypothetical protein
VKAKAPENMPIPLPLCPVRGLGVLLSLPETVGS